MPRMLTLLGLVLAFAFLAGDGWAQATTGNYLRSSTVDDYTFPYLSPDLDQKNILLNAFSFQMKLFGGIDGTATGSIEALRYLAVLAMMIGGLMFVFNAKLRNSPMTIATWLLVLIITAFAPYGSKLLFYPLSSQGLKFGYSGEESVNTSCLPSGQSGSGSDPLKCGFAPQLAAVHVAAVLQVLFSDLFNSSQWQGLIEPSNAQKSLDEEAKLNSSVWLDSKLDLERKCNGVPWESALLNRMGEDCVQDKSVPLLMKDAWQDLKNRYAAAGESSLAIYNDIPNAIVLYDNETFPEKWFEGLSDDDKSKLKRNYAAGIGEILHAVDPSNTKTVYFESPPSGGSAISIQEALKTIESKGFFSREVQGGCAWYQPGVCLVSPGFFFVWEKSAGASVADTNEALDSRRCYGIPANKKSDYQNCEDDKYSESIHLGTLNSLSAISGNGVTNSGSQARRRGSSANLLTGNVWQNFMLPTDKFSNPGNPLGNIPVSVVMYSPAPVLGELPKPTMSPNLSCHKLWNKSIDSTLASIFGNADKKTLQLQKLKDILINERTVELVDNQLPNFYDKNIKENRCDLGKSSAHVEGCDNRKLVENIEVSFNNAYRARAEALGVSTLTPSQAYEVLLVTIMNGINAASVNNIAPNEVEERAAEDAQEIRIVGSTELSTVAGGLASFFGRIAVGVASWLTGPVAVAYVYFLSIMVNLALISLIVLTPILFLAGLAMPGAAIGLLTISVVGVFVLKFVPVTLLILNNIGGMIYDMIGAGGGRASGVMQDLMIIAMAALYTNIVGMTFFLLFKLGDASAMLSRFTAIDNSAKQVADRGMALTIAATAAAGAALAAGTAAMIGGKSMADATRAAARRAGVPEDMIKVIQGAGKAREDEITEGNDPDNPEGGAAGGAATSLAGASSSVTPLSEADGIFLGKLADLEKDGILNSEQVGVLKSKTGGSVVGTDGLIYHSGRNEGDGSPYLQTMNNEGEVTTFDRLMKNDTADVGGGGSIGPVQPPKVAEQPQPGVISDKTTSGGEVDSKAVTDAKTVTTTAGGIPPSVRIEGGKLDSVGDVNMAKVQALSETPGSVQDMVKKKEMENKAALQADENKKVEDFVAKNDKLAGQNKREALALVEQFKNTSDEDERLQLLRNLEQKSTSAGGKNLKGYEVDAVKMRNLNDQIANELTLLEDRPDFKAMMENVKNNKELTGTEAELKKYYDGLRSFDTTAASMQQVFDVLGASKNLRASFDARKGADLLPSAGKNFLSGLYGSIAGSTGGLAKIPVLGPMVTESLNEYYQAPERAKAWNSVGGFSNWRELQGNAQRMGFYQKEMAPIAAGTQYDAMQALGGFQAQVDIARQAASEAVARSRSQWEAMISARNPELKMNLENDIRKSNPTISDADLSKELSMRFAAEIQKPDFKVSMDAVELRGLGAIDAASRVNTVKREAEMIRQAVLPYQSVAGGLDVRGGKGDNKTTGDVFLNSVGEGKDRRLLLETKTSDAILTPDLLSRLHSDAAVKSFAGQLDGMMVNAYGIFEKQFQRGDSAWDSTRYMQSDTSTSAGRERSALAAAQFVRSDISTDYLVGGHLKMVQGKEKFVESKGQYETLLKFRNESNQKIAQHVQQHLASVTNDIEKALRNAKVDLSKLDGLSGRALEVDQRLHLDKWAAKELKAKGVMLPLNVLFDASMVKGAASYTRKANKAFYEEQSEALETWTQTQKAASAAISASLSDVKNLTKTISFERDGVKSSIGTSTDKLFEKFDMAFGARATEAIKVFNSYFSKPELQKSAFDIKIDTSDASDPKGWMRANMDEFKKFAQELNKNSPGMGDVLLNELNNKDSKIIREKDGKVEWGYLDKNNKF